MVKKPGPVSALGATFEALTPAEKRNLGINNGVKVVNVNSGKFRSNGVKEGFVITQINNRNVNSPEDVRRIVEEADGGIYIEGIYPDGHIAYYSIPL